MVVDFARPPTAPVVGGGPPGSDPSLGPPAGWRPGARRRPTGRRQPGI